jgi:hypothetical protein
MSRKPDQIKVFELLRELYDSPTNKTASIRDLISAF